MSAPPSTTSATPGPAPPSSPAPAPVSAPASASALVPADALVRAFERYLARTLAEANAGSAQTLRSPLRFPTRSVAVAVCVGKRPKWWFKIARARAGLRVGFSGTAGRDAPSTRLDGTDAGRRTPVTILDRWDPSRVEPTPAAFDVLAIVTTFNEADVIGDLLDRLRADHIRVHVIDNWSTDDTFGIVTRRAAHDAGVTFERFPEDGPAPYFELERMLERVEVVAHASGADWVVSHDADEVRQPPWPGVSLRRGLWCVERFGFNCVDHVVMNFRPIDESWDRDDRDDRDDRGDPGAEPDGPGPDDRGAPGSRLLDAFTWFEFGDHHAAFRQQKAWKPQHEPVRFASSGGHDPELADRRVFPYRFLLRHYPIRSTGHGRRKVLHERKGRWSPEERAKGWHVHYDAYTESSTFLWDPATLHRFTSIEDLDRRLLVERLSGAGLPANPFPGEGIEETEMSSGQFGAAD